MFRIDTKGFSQDVDLKTLAGLLLSAMVLVGTVSTAAAHHYDAPQYPMPAPNYGPGPIYNFYGPTTNYFGASPDDQGPPAGYDGPPAYYGEAPSR